MLERFHFIAQVVLKTWQSCLSLSNAGITDVGHHTLLGVIFKEKTSGASVV